ncbi:CRISPR-associated endoribonuclease Cse3 [Dissostichus eleginoides]|uniref:CRISPR-associated endoribonuclease Cse3 n=1 Tax=Dissostichus eleginoides TaxID=100907 RepID=A0AAD9C7P7_DISEL|nr:CRISPR-associated endoribonuclease Cse3 [Dissostichus eleginoides]
MDSSVITLMTDDQLREYLPSYGDRLAVFGYCRRKEKEPTSRKSKLFERLRGKLSRNKGDRVSETDHQTAPKNAQKNAQKNQRKIEIGWVHFREGEFVQVRTKKGGGTRKESVTKDSKKQNLIEKAVQLFFPDGKNAEGSLTDFDIDLTDFQRHSLEDSITVKELYEKTKLPLLRFYLTTKKRDIASDINLVENNSDATAQEGENTHARPDIYHLSTDTSATAPVEISRPTSDVIFVGSSTVFANENSDSVSLLYTTVNPTDASSLQEHETLFHVGDLEDSGIVTFRTDSISLMEYSSLDDTLPLSTELSIESSMPPSMDMFQEQANQRESEENYCSSSWTDSQRTYSSVF